MKKPARISFKNQLLVSMPQLTTPHFHQTVSLICQHDDNGAIGVIINRLTDHRLGDIFEQLALPVSNLERAEQPVFEGGPVNPELGLVIHAGGEGKWESSLEIGGGLWLTSSRDILGAIARGEGPAHAIMILGYAGWGPGQLESEMPRGRILGLDFGMRRIGVAIGNTGSGGAQAVATVAARGGAPDWPALQKHIDDWAPAALAVGLPLNMDGSEGDMAKRARKFGRQAGARFGLPVRFIDERLTTRAAEALLQDTVGRGRVARRRAEKRDAMAAALIARAYIDAAGKSTVTAATVTTTATVTEATVTAATAAVTEATVTATVTTTAAAADG